MPKLCQICGHVDMMGQADTCPKCGEATWRPAGVWAPEPALQPVEDPRPTPASKSVPRRGGRS